MAVYTEVSFDEAATFLQTLELGTLQAIKGCAGGIENTNYFVDTDQGEFVLTLFERLTFEQLPFYLHLMKHLAELSDREKECLFWASEGKTSWEIATILGISERTVNFHLNQVTNKTDSKNRNQAIAKSISSGIIVPSLDDVTITNLRLS